MTKITVSNGHGFKVGDKIAIQIENGFWKIFWHWILQKNLRRQDVYTNISCTTMEMELSE